MNKLYNILQITIMAFLVLPTLVTPAHADLPGEDQRMARFAELLAHRLQLIHLHGALSNPAAGDPSDDASDEATDDSAEDPALSETLGLHFLGSSVPL